jgi:hypothetical protein
METFTKLFGGLLIIVYHHFDRIVINGYPNGLSRRSRRFTFSVRCSADQRWARKFLVSEPMKYRNWVENPYIVARGYWRTRST